MTTTKLCAALAACILSACAEQHEASRDDDSFGEPEPGQASADRPAARRDGGSSGVGAASASGVASGTGVVQRDAGATGPIDVPSSLPSADLIDVCPAKSFAPSRLQDLVSGAGRCSFLTDWPVVADPGFVNVYVGERVRPMLRAGETWPVSDGWRLEPDGRTFTLIGAACVDAQAGAAIKLEVACIWTILP